MCFTANREFFGNFYRSFVFKKMILFVLADFIPGSCTYPHWQWVYAVFSFFE